MISVKFRAAAALVLMTGLAACETDPYTGEQRVSGAGSGALGGAAVGGVLGAIIGGRDARAAALLGAGIGAIAGATIGDAAEQNQRRLESDLRGSGYYVRREGETILITAPGGVGFAPNSTAILPEVRPALERAARTIADYRASYVDVLGYADSREPDPRALSRERARVVADFLRDRGVAPARIEIAGRSDEQPLSRDPSDRAANRRVEIRITAAREEDFRRGRGRY